MARKINITGFDYCPKGHICPLVCHYCGKELKLYYGLAGTGGDPKRDGPAAEHWGPGCEACTEAEVARRKEWDDDHGG